MKTVLTIFALSLPFLLFSQQTLTQSITHDGLQRDYILYVPATYTGDEAVPLVLNFHGYTSNAKEQMGYGDFRPIADTAGFIIVHPQGTLLDGKTHWNVGGWTLASKIDDVGFTAALIDSLSASYNINQNRIYATGMSNGGYMSFLLACQLSNKIAAIASVTGSMTIQTYDACDPQHPTPVMQVHGTKDGTVPYEGNPFWTKSIDDVMTYWISYNHCKKTPAATQLPDVNTSDGSTVEHLIYEKGDQHATSEHYKVTGGNHKWPLLKGGGPGTNHDFNATLEIWRFFLRYDLKGLRK